MPVYAWKGLNNTGKAVAGTKDADGPKGLRLALRKEGIYVTEHKEVLGGVGGRPGGKGATLASGEKVPFFKREIDLGGLLGAAGDHGHVLITSRDPGWSQMTRTVPVDVLPDPLLQANGIIQREGQVIHVLARRMIDRTELLDGLSQPSRDFH